MSKDWVAWHRDYEDPTSSLARRLQVVQGEISAVLRGARPANGELRLISICAGDGRDVLPVLAEHGRGVLALLVELDPVLSERARRTAAELGLTGVEVRTGDAGVADAYRDLIPAHVVLACGVFGNISLADVQHTITALPSLLADDGVVIWTRGRNDDGRDPSTAIRELFIAQGFTEVGFTAPEGARFRVGMHRLGARPTDVPLEPGLSMFTFTASDHSTPGRSVSEHVDTCAKHATQANASGDVCVDRARPGGLPRGGIELRDGCSWIK